MSNMKIDNTDIKPSRLVYKLSLKYIHAIAVIQADGVLKSPTFSLNHREQPEALSRTIFHGISNSMENWFSILPL